MDVWLAIQQAYEILSDACRRQRYDDQVRLAELRREAMMRRTPPPRSSPAREYRQYENLYEVRQPRYTEDYPNPYGEPLRETSRKFSKYDTRHPKAWEKENTPSRSGVGPGTAFAKAAAEFKPQAEKIRRDREDEKRLDKEKTKERSEKRERWANQERRKEKERRKKADRRRRVYWEESDSDSDSLDVRSPMKSTPS